jgi:type I restriction enzyme S subunit
MKAAQRPADPRGQTFLQKLDALVDAPHTVEQLRGLVLDLAFAGRLLPTKTAWPLKLLHNLASKIGSGATPDGGRESYFTKGIPLIRSMNVHFHGFNPTGLVFLSDEQAEELANVTVQADDVLLNITGASIGRVTTAPAQMAGARVNQHVTIIRPTTELFPSFLAKFLASPTVQRMIDEIQVGATRQALTKGMIEQFEIPLPPLAEQKRIVAKVDELMALCDRLEAQLQERDTRQAALARAALARFADAPTPANLELLFLDSFTITPTDLRNTILTLAVQGQLTSGVMAAPVSMEDLVGRANLKNGLSVRPTSTRTPFFCLSLSALRSGQVDCSSGKPVPLTNEQAKPYLIRKGDIFVVRGNGSKDLVGRAGLVRDEPTGMIFPDLFIRIPLPADQILSDYFIIAWNSPLLRETIERLAQTTSGIWKINQGHVAECEIPLPPLAEQRRIVAKVDQLMALVDRWESQLAATRTTADRLLTGLVAQLTTPQLTSRQSARDSRGDTPVASRSP